MGYVYGLILPAGQHANLKGANQPHELPDEIHDVSQEVLGPNIMWPNSDQGENQMTLNRGTV